MRPITTEGKRIAVLGCAAIIAYLAGNYSGSSRAVFDGRLHVAEKRFGALVTINSCTVKQKEAYRIQIRREGKTYTLYDYNKDNTIDSCDRLQLKDAQEMYKKYVPELFDTSGLAAKTFEKW